MSDDDPQKRVAKIIAALVADWLQSPVPIVEEVMLDLSRALSENKNHREL